MTEKILFVDDDVRIVTSFQRALYKEYVVETAVSPKQALDTVLDGQFAVVVSDQNMPGMNGTELLREIKLVAPYTVGILLTGLADLETAIQAVNHGHIFRFLRKPCPREILTSTLDAALKQYRLLCAEKDFLRETLIGTVGMLMEVLSTVQPDTFGRTVRIRQLIRDLTHELKLTHVWEVEAAGLLSQIGCFCIAPEVLKKYLAGADLLPEEQSQIACHASVGSHLVSQVSRLSTVAQIIQHQSDSFQETFGLRPEGLTVAIGSQILRVALDFDRLVRTGSSRANAVARMRKDVAEYNPQVIEALNRLVAVNMDFRAMHDGQVPVTLSKPHLLENFETCTE